MKFVRILSLVLVILMMASTFVACDMLADLLPSTEEVEEEVLEPMTLQVVEQSYTEYVIVRDYKASGTVLNAVSSLQSSFKDYLGCEIMVKECYNDREEPDDIEQATEILVGTTNRKESAQVADGLKTNDYNIDVVGDKIVIVGGSDDATEKALSKFLVGLVQAQGSKSGVSQGEKQNMFIYKNLPEEDVNKKYDITIDTFGNIGKYSYGKVTMAQARMDSYLLVCPADDNLSSSNRAFAEELQTYVNRQAGYYMDIKKDVAVVRADYMITIGATSFTDEALVEAMGDDEYYIALTAKEVKLADGSVVPSAVMTILYGIDAEEAAMNAFKEMMPTSSSKIDFNVAAGFVKTNMKNPPAAK